MVYFHATDEYYLTNAGVQELKEKYNLDGMELKIVTDEIDITSVMKDSTKVMNTAFVSLFRPEKISQKFIDLFDIRRPENKFGMLTTQQKKMKTDDEYILTEKLKCTVIRPSVTLKNYITDPDSVGLKRIVNSLEGLDVRKELGMPGLALFMGGIPGTGKTHLAECIAGHLNRLLIFCNLSFFINHEWTFELLNEFFNFFKFNAGKYVVIFDEIEKMFNESPKATQVMGYILTMMSGFSKNPHYKADILFIATANNISALSLGFPEFFRKGRWDFVIFLAAPNEKKATLTFQLYVEIFNNLFVQKNIPYLFDCYFKYDNMEQLGTLKGSKMEAILLRLRAIPRLQEIKEEYRLALEEDVKEKKDELGALTGHTINVFEDGLYAKGSFYRIAMKDEEVKTVVEEIIAKYHFEINIEEFMHLAFLEYRDKIPNDRSRFPYVSAEIEGMIKDLYSNYFTSIDCNITDESYLKEYIRNTVPLQISMSGGIAKMEAAATNFIIL